MGEIDLSQVFARLRAMDRRVQVLVAGAAALLLYLAVLGFQYMGEIRAYEEMVLRQQDLVRTINLGANLEPVRSGELEAAGARLEQAQEKFTFGHIDELLVFIPEVASRSRVTLTSSGQAAGSGDSAGRQTHGGVSYRVHRMTLRVEGSRANIDQFVEELTRSAAVSVRSISLSGLGETPSAALEVSLFMDPSGGGS